MPEVANQDGETALHIAARQGDTRMIAYLLPKMQTEVVGAITITGGTVSTMARNCDVKYL